MKELPSIDLDTFRDNATRALLGERVAEGHWEGELSTSALSTATAIVALHCVDASAHRDLITKGVDWLIRHQNSDGGWGDTTRSFSNISTTLLAWSALHRCGDSQLRKVQKAQWWIQDYVGSLEPHQIAETVKARYGKDRTFSVPILMHCAICGTLGKRGWDLVLPLPYELAAFPRKWFAALQLPVVSYALPALIAIGRARFERRPPRIWNPLRWSRIVTWPGVSKLLHQIQPASGGYLEAAPLTSFVTMALASAGKSDHPAAVSGARFLVETVRPDGSWPIDTNLATWTTTLAVKALEKPPREVLRWVLDQQYKRVHPFTNSPPGGWAWTDLTGGVPDADDTPGAMLAIHDLADQSTFNECREAAQSGAAWLLDLQNRDGGIPTFCRGWGALPFDRSSPDLTAHTLRAWITWKDHFTEDLQERIDSGTREGLKFLHRKQRVDGSWIPLWFGNQHRSRDEENPTYGTSIVCRALESLPADEAGVGIMLQKGMDWLRKNQNLDGGWGAGLGTPSSIEETALAISALAIVAEDAKSSEDEGHETGIFCKFRYEESRASLTRGVTWLEKATEQGTKFPSTPIGFYFAKLWYFERIYPVVWTVEALERVDTYLNKE